MTTLIAPSILAADFANLESEAKMLNSSLADYYHIDVMDGHFVPNISYGMPVIKAIKKYAKKPLDVLPFGSLRIGLGKKVAQNPPRPRTDRAHQPPRGSFVAARYRLPRLMQNDIPQGCKCRATLWTRFQTRRCWCFMPMATHWLRVY